MKFGYIRVFPTNFIFFRENQIILRGKKRTALLQTYAQIYANTRRGGGHIPLFLGIYPPGANRVRKKHRLCARLYVAFPQTSAFAIEGFLLPLLAVFGVAGQTTLESQSL